MRITNFLLQIGALVAMLVAGDFIGYLQAERNYQFAAQMQGFGGFDQNGKFRWRGACGK